MKNWWIALVFCCNLVFSAEDPDHTGTFNCIPNISAAIDVLNAKVHVTTDSLLDKSTFDIEYQFISRKEGIQIPFIFFEGEGWDTAKFKVYLDNELVSINYFPKNQTRELNQPLVFHSNEFYGIDLSEYIYNYTYFEKYITKGIHNIRIRYISENGFFEGLYADSPYIDFNFSNNENWDKLKSFEFILNAQSVDDKVLIESNFMDKVLVKNAVYSFKSSYLPVDQLKFSFEPKYTHLGDLILDITPENIISGIWLVLISVMLYIIALERKHTSNDKILYAVKFSIAILPFILLYVKYLVYLVLKSQVIPPFNHHFYAQSMNSLWYFIILPSFGLFVVIWDYFLIYLKRKNKF